MDHRIAIILTFCGTQLPKEGVRVMAQHVQNKNHLKLHANCPLNFLSTHRQDVGQGRTRQEAALWAPSVKGALARNGRQGSLLNMPLVIVACFHGILTRQLNCRFFTMIWRLIVGASFCCPCLSVHLRPSER